MGVLRRTIATFHTEHNELPTLRKLKQVLNDKIRFDGCIGTLLTIYKESSYEWSKIDENRNDLIEKHDIQLLCFQYLKQLKKYRDEGRYLVFTDETYIHTTHVQNVLETSARSMAIAKKKLSKGMRIIVIHARRCKRFVSNANLASRQTQQVEIIMTT